MAATAKILNLPVSPLHQQTPPGAVDFSPLLGITHATASNTIKVYLGEFPTATVVAVSLIVNSLDGTVHQTLATVLGADGTSATYTSGSGDAWIATAGVSFALHASVTLVGDVSAPGASAVAWLSSPVTVNVVT